MLTKIPVESSILHHIFKYTNITQKKIFFILGYIDKFYIYDFLPFDSHMILFPPKVKCVMYTEYT